MFSRSIKIAYSNIKSNLTRSIITIIGIAIAVLSLCLIAVIGDFGKEMISSEFKSLGGECLMVGVNGEENNLPLTDNEAEILKSNKYVSSVSSIITKLTQIRMRGYISKSLVWGIDENAKDIVSLKIVYGKLFSKDEIRARENVCVVDKTVAKSFYGRENIVGKNIDIFLNGAYVRFKIIGVVKTGGGMMQGIMADYIPNFVYIPSSVLQKYLGTSQYDKFAVLTNKNMDKVVASNSIQNTLSNATGMVNGYIIKDMSEANEQAENLTKNIEKILSFIALISLIVATMNIMTIMVSATKERTREIGIKKAVGATTFDILLEFAAEILTLGLIGSIIGTLFAEGLLACFNMALKAFQATNLNLSLSLGFIAPITFSALSVGLSLVFGIYPAYKASKLDAVDALR